MFARTVDVVSYRMWRSIALEPQWATHGPWLDAHPFLCRALEARRGRDLESATQRRR